MNSMVFERKESTNTELISFTESLIGSIDIKEKVEGVFMDLSKAFNSISHDIPLRKLKGIEINN